MHEYGFMLQCLETTPYKGRIPRLHDSNAALFNDRTVRISAPDITDRVVRHEMAKCVNNTTVSSSFITGPVSPFSSFLPGKIE